MVLTLRRYPSLLFVSKQRTSTTAFNVRLAHLSPCQYLLQMRPCLFSTSCFCRQLTIVIIAATGTGIYVARFVDQSRRDGGWTKTKEGPEGIILKTNFPRPSHNHSCNLFVDMKWKIEALSSRRLFLTIDKATSKRSK